SPVARLAYACGHQAWGIVDSQCRCLATTFSSHRNRTVGCGGIRDERGHRQTCRYRDHPRAPKTMEWDTSSGPSSRFGVSDSFARAFRNPGQDVALVHGYMIGFIAHDFILWIIRAAPAHMTFVFSIRGVLFNDGSRDFTGFRIPANMVSNRKCFTHGSTP